MEKENERDADPSHYGVAGKIREKSRVSILEGGEGELYVGGGMGFLKRAAALGVFMRGLGREGAMQREVCQIMRNLV